MTIPSIQESLVRSFVQETGEWIDQANAALLALEADPKDEAAINALFRSVHSIKGASGLFDVPAMTHVLHAAEDLLGRIRDKTLTIDPPLADDLLDGLDTVAGWMRRIEPDGVLGPDCQATARDLAARYRRHFEGKTLQEEAASGPAAGQGVQALPNWVDAEFLEKVSTFLTPSDEELVLVRYEPGSECFFSGEDPLHLILQVPGVLHSDVTTRAPWPAPEEFDPFICNLRFRLASRAPLETIEHLFRYVPDEVDIRLMTGPARVPSMGSPSDGTSPSAGPPEVPPPAGPSRPDEANRSLRVEQSTVDALMNLVGEMVVAKNALPFLARKAEDQAGSRELSRDIKDQYAVVDRIVQDMQAAMMDIRMLPVSEMFRRFPRLVRDLGRKLGKPVRLVTEGESTRADKNIIEALAEPVTHLIRNSIDHGIEPAADRRASGKPEEATLALRAMREGNSVILEVADDGRGIDPEKLRDKAVSMGLLDVAQAKQMSDAEAVGLVFLPGLSTAREVSDVSGRGVGMDAVRSAVERQGGTVEIASTLGVGTIIRLHLPLSLAATRVMSVALDGQLYGIPMEHVVETVRLPRDRFRRLKSAETVILRDAVLPVVRLRSALGLPTRHPEREAILVIRLNGARVGLAVDDFHTGMDVILKPMTGVLAGTRGYGGTAVLGDGKLLLVLNLKEIF